MEKKLETIRNNYKFILKQYTEDNVLEDDDRTLYAKSLIRALPHTQKTLYVLWLVTKKYEDVYKLFGKKGMKNICLIIKDTHNHILNRRI